MGVKLLCKYNDSWIAHAIAEISDDNYSWVQNDRPLRAVVAFVFGLPLFTSGAVAVTRDLLY